VFGSGERVGVEVAAGKDVAVGDGMTDGIGVALGVEVVKAVDAEMFGAVAQEENRKANTIIRGSKFFISKRPSQ